MSTFTINVSEPGLATTYLHTTLFTVDYQSTTLSMNIFTYDYDSETKNIKADISFTGMMQNENKLWNQVTVAALSTGQPSWGTIVSGELVINSEMVTPNDNTDVVIPITMLEQIKSSPIATLFIESFNQELAYRAQP